VISKSSDFWVCPLILYSHSIRARICLRRKFNNQQNAQHTAAVHYKDLRPALQLFVNSKLFSYHTHMRNIWGLLLLDWISLRTGMFPFKFHLKYLLVWNSWLIGEIFIKDLFENEKRKGKFSSSEICSWSWASAEIFPGGGKVDILLILFRFLTMQCKWTYTKRFTLSAPQRKWPMLWQRLQTVFPLLWKFYTEQMFVLVSMNISDWVGRQF